MKKFVLLALASLAFGVQESEFKVYEQILNQLDTKQIPAFVVQTAKPNLPSRVDEMITLKDVSSEQKTRAKMATRNYSYPASNQKDVCPQSRSYHLV